MPNQWFGAAMVAALCVAVPSVLHASNPPTLRAVRGRFGLIEEVRAMDRLGLRRIQSRDELIQLTKSGELVRVPDRGRGFAIDDRIGSLDRRHRNLYKHARPEARDLITTLGAMFRRAFGGAFRVNSLVRSHVYQRLLAQGNPTALQAVGTSSHTTGYTFDVAKLGLRGRELRWFRRELLSREGEDTILATEEVGCFHVMALSRPPVP